MGQSWGHTVRLLTEDERAYVERSRERWGPRFYSCSTRNCEEHVTHKVGYRYVTGRAGRVSSAEKLACETHAQRFADKHDLTMPTEPSARESRTGYMAVSEAIEELHGR